MLQWFRRKAAAAQEAPQEAAPPAPAEDDAPSSGADAEQKRRRRRGNRGGRGRKKPGQAAKTEAAAEAPARSGPEKRDRGGRTRGGDAKAKRRKPAPRRSSGGSRAALAGVKKEILVSVGVGETRVAAPRGRQRQRGLHGAARPPLDRRERLQGHRRQRAARHGGVVRRHRPGQERLPLRGRDRRPRARGQAPRPPDPGADLARREGARPGGQGPDGHQGRPAHDRDLAARPLPRLHTVRRGRSGSPGASRTTSASG